jgi:ABC-type branched-subunit amino acid transport system substrate-binding protein
MEHRSPRHLRRLSIAIAALLALALAACSNSSSTGSKNDTAAASAQSGNGAPGVTSTEIRFAAFGTRSNNPLGTCVLDCYVQGIEAYFAYRNSQGGIHGRKLVVSQVEDDELLKDQQAALRVTTANSTFAAFSAAELAAGWSTIAKAGMPLYVWPINPADMNGRDSVFGSASVTCLQCTRREYTLAAEKVGAKRIATLGYGATENSKLCASGAAASIDLYGPKTGQRTAYTNNSLAFGLPNGVGPEVSAMKKAGVDMIVGCLDLNGMKSLAQELDRQGMGSVPVLHLNTYDQDFVSKAGKLFEGDYVAVSFRPFESAAGSSVLDEYKTWMAKAKAPLTELSMNGWINADLAYQGLKAAGPSFDRAKVIAATNKITSFTAGGLIAPVDWTRQHEAPTPQDPTTHGYKDECISLVKVVDGRFQVVGPADKPYFCWPGSDTSWSEPRSVDFS